MDKIFDHVFVEESLWLHLSNNGAKYLLTEKVRHIEQYYVETILNGRGYSENIRSIKGNGFYKIRLNYSQRIPFRIYDNEAGETCLHLGNILSHQEGEALHTEGYSFGDETSELDLQDAFAEIESLNIDDDYSYFSEISRHLSTEDQERIINNADAELKRVLNKAQNDFLQESGPLLLKGTAGSGKTTVCIYRLLQSLTSNKIYVTYTPHLKKYAEKIFLNLTVGLNVPPVKFVTIEEFCFSFLQDSQKFQPHQKMTFEVFKSLDFVQDSVRRERISPYILWEEIRGVLKQVSHPLSYQDYQEITSHRGIAKAVHRIYQKYQDYLNTYKMWDDIDLARAAFRRVLGDRAVWKYDEIIVDEVQDLTTMHFYLLTNAVTHPTGLFLAGDESQSIHPSKFSWQKVEQILNSNPSFQHQKYFYAYRHLIENYRSPESVFNLVKAIKQWRNETWKEGDDFTEVTTHKKGGDPVELISPQHFQDFHIEIAPTDTMILVPSESIKPEARNKFGVGSVLTITEAKGLENKNIILYKFFEEEQTLRTLKMHQLAHHSERFSRSQVTTLNLLHVALTRAQKQVFILSEKDNMNVLSPCQEFPFQETTGDSLKASLKTQQEDPNEYFLWGRQLELNGSLEQAEANYIKAGKLGDNRGFAYGNKCRGLIAKAEHRYQDAIAAFEVALETLEDISILENWEECSGLIALSNQQLETAKNHFLSAKIPPDLIISRLMSVSSDEKYNVALKLILQYSPQQLEKFHQDQSKARQLSLSVSDAFQSATDHPESVSDYARLRSQFYQEKIKKQYRSKYQKLSAALKERLGNFAPEELQQQSDRVNEMNQLQTEIDDSVAECNQVIHQHLNGKKIPSIMTEKNANIVDSNLETARSLLQKHRQKWYKTVRQILNHRLGEVRICLLKLSELKLPQLKTIIQRARKTDLEEIVDYLVENQTFLPEVVNILLKKSPDPDLILKLRNRANNEAIQKQCAEYLLEGYSPQPSFSSRLMEVQFEIDFKRVRTSKKQRNRFYKLVHWSGKYGQGITVFQETRRGWLVYSEQLAINN